MTFVFSFIASSAFLGSKQKPSSSTSTKTGLAPAIIITDAVAKKVNGVVITSSPGPIPFANMAK